MTRRSELPNTREKIPVMNVHIPLSVDIPVKIEEVFTSFTSSFDPEIWYESPGMKILRDEKISPEMGGSGSGNSLSILNKY